MLPMNRLTVTTGIDFLGRDFVADVELNFSPGYEAQTYGPAENCYPAEGAEIDILNVEIWPDIPGQKERGAPLELPAWLQTCLREQLQEGDDYERLINLASEDYSDSMWDEGPRRSRYGR